MLLFLFASILFADETLPFNLAGDWRFKQGDDPAYAQPGFDDSAWSTRSLPRGEDPPFGISWLRARFVLPPQTPDTPLFLTLGTFAESYEVWCNGVPIGNTGGFSDARRRFARPRTFATPKGLLKPGQPFTLALRMFESPVRGPLPRRLDALPDPGPYVLTDSSRIPANGGPLEALRREKLAAVGYATSALRALLILLLLGAWIIDRGRRELVFLSLLLSADLFARFGESLAVSVDSSFLPFRLVAVCSVLSGTMLARFAFEVFRVRSRWLHLAIWLPPLLMVIAAGTAGVGWAVASVVLMNVSDLMVAVLAAGGARDAIRTRAWKSGAFVMSVSIGVVALLHTQRLGPIMVFNLFLPFAGYLFHLYDILVILLTALMTLVLLLSLGADRREKQRLTGELDAARAVQQLLLAPPASTPGYDVETVYQPAHEVGGDFYWTRRASTGALLVVAGDVSGKGLRAAMLVNLMIGALRERDIEGPAAILSLLNRVLIGQTHGGFVTAICFRMNGDGTMVAANAGHPAPYLNGEPCDLAAALPLGLDRDASYGEAALHLVTGGQLTIISDGVIEAASPTGELFGFDRAQEIAVRPANQIADAARTWGQNDDITVVTVRRAVA